MQFHITVSNAANLTKKILLSLSGETSFMPRSGADYTAGYAGGKVVVKNRSNVAIADTAGGIKWALLKAENLVIGTTEAEWAWLKTKAGVTG